MIFIYFRKSSIVLDDFNTHSAGWGYAGNNTTGNLEDFTDFDPTELIDK